VAAGRQDKRNTVDKQLISQEYARLNRKLHEDELGYGGSAGPTLEAEVTGILNLALHYGARSILDFGCGKGQWAEALRRRAPPHLTIWEYDPAIPGKEAMPAQADIVIAMDVMEHIEPAFLGNVLEAIRGLSPMIFIAQIALLPAQKTLPDGRNAHLILKPVPWWLKQLSKAFTIIGSEPVHFEGQLTHLTAICGLKGKVRALKT